MTIKEMYECHRFRIKLSLGISSYPLPDIALDFRGAYHGGLALLNKADGLTDRENEPFWDFEIENNSINLNREFTSMLDFEGEESIDLVFYGRVSL
jgi:hypothetical protein